MNKYKVIRLKDGSEKTDEVEAFYFEATTVPSSIASTTVTFYNDAKVEIYMFAYVSSVELIKEES